MAEKEPINLEKAYGAEHRNGGPEPIRVVMARGMWGGLYRMVTVSSGLVAAYRDAEEFDWAALETTMARRLPGGLADLGLSKNSGEVKKVLDLAEENGYRRDEALDLDPTGLKTITLIKEVGIWKPMQPREEMGYPPISRGRTVIRSSFSMRGVHGKRFKG